LTKDDCKELILKLPDTQISEVEKKEIKKILANIKAKFFTTSQKSNEKIDFSDEQLKAINCTAKNILLKARAGSGKTAVLVERAKRLLNRGEDVLLLAFNKKASEEMKRRIGNNFQNSKTFHSFAYSIVKPKDKIIFERKQLEFLQDLIFSEKNNFPDIDFSTIGNDEISQKKANLSEEYFVQYIRNRSDISLNGDEVKSNGEKWIADFLFENGVNFEYEQEFSWDRKSYCPDFTIENRVILEHWGIDETQENGNTPQDWTKSFADYKSEMERKREFWKNNDKILIETSIADLKNGREEFEKILKDRLEKVGIKFRKLSTSEIYKKMDFPIIYKITELVNSYISQARQKNLKPEDLAKKIPNFPETQNFLLFANRIFKKYQDSNKIDFLNLLELAIKNIKRDDIENFNHILIDEFQDFSPIFYELISKIITLKPEINIFAVGDDWQGINGFAGADLGYFQNFGEYFPNPKILEMNTNYRSLSEIVNYGNKILEGKDAVAYRQGGEVLEVSKMPTFPKDKKIAILVRTNYEKKGIPKCENCEVITAHKSKGLEFDEVLIWNKDSFGKIHPDNKFFKIFGKSENEILEEEKRLFYVAVTRAKEKLYII